MTVAGSEIVDRCLHAHRSRQEGGVHMWKRDQSVTPPPAGRDQSAESAPADSQSTEKLVMDLGKSVVIKGELSGSEDLTLYGQMEGSIRLPDHTLTIGPQADIKADISAKAVVIMGRVTGKVTAG